MSCLNSNSNSKGLYWHGKHTFTLPKQVYSRNQNKKSSNKDTIFNHHNVTVLGEEQEGGRCHEKAIILSGHCAIECGFILVIKLVVIVSDRV